MEIIQLSRGKNNHLAPNDGGIYKSGAFLHLIWGHSPTFLGIISD